MGCNPQLEDPAPAELAEMHNALTSSVTETVTPGACTTNVVFETITAPAPGFQVTCSSKCLNDSTGWLGDDPIRGRVAGSLSRAV